MGMLIPDLAVSIFTTDEELVRISAKGLRIVVMFFPIVGFQMVTSNFFQSIGMASKAIFLSVSRQVSNSDTLSADPSTLLRTTRSLDQYADFRPDSKYDCRNDALVSVSPVLIIE